MTDRYRSLDVNEFAELPADIRGRLALVVWRGIHEFGRFAELADGDMNETERLRHEVLAFRDRLNLLAATLTFDLED